MNGKVALALGLLVVAAIAAWYFLFYKGGAAAKILAAPTGLGPADNATFQALINYFKANTSDNGSALDYLLPDVEGVLDGTGLYQPSADYRVAGRLPKSGAFMAIYAGEYYREDGSMQLKAGMTPQQFNGDLYRIFNAYKTQALQQHLLAS